MEITSDGLTLGAGTVLAKMARDRRGPARLALDDKPRVTATASVRMAGTSPFACFHVDPSAPFSESPCACQTGPCIAQGNG
jgi:hypothetical protein